MASDSPQDVTSEVGIQGVVAAVGVAGRMVKFILPLPTGHVDVQCRLVTQAGFFFNAKQAQGA